MCPSSRWETSSAFASDNAAPAHPKAIEAIVNADQDDSPSYGNDPITARAADRTASR